MRVLLIGYFSESSGWGQASRDYAIALDAAGVDVVIRTVHINSSQHEFPQRLKELHEKSSAGCDICIQHLLPHHMEFHGGFEKNIGLFVCETDSFRDSTWADQLNLMDAVIVPCRANWAAARRSGVNVPIHIVPHATDISRFQRSYEPLEQLKPFREQESFIFYVIGEWVRRKNFGSLLRAFHTEFDVGENVELVIKTNVPGSSSGESASLVQGACDEIKRSLKLHGDVKDYKSEIVITDRLTSEGIMRLHAACDCFVSPTHGEAWMIPAFDAMAMGKTPIVPDVSPFSDYLVEERHFADDSLGGWLVPSYETQVFGANDTFDDLYTGRERWCDVNQFELQSSMRQVFSDSRARTDRSLNGRENAYNFTYETIGVLFEKVLHNEQKANNRSSDETSTTRLRLSKK